MGSLGAIYNGILLINLAIALFALVAIESSSQKLGRTYAVLLFCAILLDISWFILFTYEIWYVVCPIVLSNTSIMLNWCFAFMSCPVIDVEAVDPLVENY